MTLGVLMYFLVLALFSAVVAYVILFTLFPVRGRLKKDEAHAEEVHVAAHHAPQGEARPATPRSTFSAHEGFSSCKTGDELCVEDIVKALSRG